MDDYRTCVRHSASWQVWKVSPPRRTTLEDWTLVGFRDDPNRACDRDVFRVLFGASETALETSQQCLAVPRKTAGFGQATEKPQQREERESAPKLMPAPNNMK